MPFSTPLPPIQCCCGSSKVEVCIGPTLKGESGDSEVFTPKVGGMARIEIRALSTIILAMIVWLLAWIDNVFRRSNSTIKLMFFMFHTVLYCNLYHMSLPITSYFVKFKLKLFHVLKSRKKYSKLVAS